MDRLSLILKVVVAAAALAKFAHFLNEEKTANAKAEVTASKAFKTGDLTKILEALHLADDKAVREFLTNTRMPIFDAAGNPVKGKEGKQKVAKLFGEGVKAENIQSSLLNLFRNPATWKELRGTAVEATKMDTPQAKIMEKLDPSFARNLEIALRSARKEIRKEHPDSEDAIQSLLTSFSGKKIYGPIPILPRILSPVEAIVEKAIRESLEKLGHVEIKGELTESDLEKVTELDLSGTKITDVGLKEVAKLQQLKDLNLTNTQITDAGLKEVAKLQKLTQLYLSETKITDTGVAELRKALPKCDIRHSYKKD